METASDIANYDLARRAQERLVHYLELPRAADVLGIYAVELLTRAMKAEVILPVRTGDNILQADISHLCDSESIPVVAANSGDIVEFNHVVQTPAQYQATLDVLDDTEGLRNALSPRAYQLDVTSSVAGLACPTELWEGRIDRYHVTIGARPLVALNTVWLPLPEDCSGTLLHELSHASDFITQSLLVLHEDDDKDTHTRNMRLVSELKAYALEARTSFGGFWRACEQAQQIEAIRQSVNGDLFDNPQAFDPNDDIKAELKKNDLAHIWGDDSA